MRIDGSGAVFGNDGALLVAAKPGGWCRIAHLNSDVFELPNAADRRQHGVLILPRRADLFFSMLGETVVDELQLSFALRGAAVDDWKIQIAVGAFELQEVLQRDPTTLSGGQRARLALALAVLNDPKVLILENALDPIDAESRERILKELHQLANSGLRIVEMTTSPPEERAFAGDAVTTYDCSDDRIKPARSSSTNRDAVQFPQGPVLSVRSLVFEYPTGFRLHADSLDLHPGEVVWLTGRNGAGKTTFMKSLALLVEPIRGTVSVSSSQRGDLKLTFPEKRSVDVHRWMLYQFQEPDDQIFCATVEEELAITARNSAELAPMVDEVAEILGLSCVMKKSPWDISRSRRRLLALGSVLCARPPIALLDEPTAELDAQERSRVADALLWYTSRGGACVVVSHDRAFMSLLATRNVDVSDGLVGT
jgi:energy-coupling factor transporter ATP-binding protein EcfA2